MAYVCDIDQMGAARRVDEVPEKKLGAIAALPQRALDWLVAWNEAAEEAAVARRTFGNSGGKLTDGLEREMMQQLLRTDWR